MSHPFPVSIEEAVRAELTAQAKVENDAAAAHLIAEAERRDLYDAEFHARVRLALEVIRVDGAVTGNWTHSDRSLVALGVLMAEYDPANLEHQPRGR